MPYVFHVDHKVMAMTTMAATAGLAIYSTYRLWSLKRNLKKENVYETNDSLHQYLLLHYGSHDELISPWNSLVDKSYLDFPKRCADLCLKYSKPESGKETRALDIGCAVGRSSFELTRGFKEVVGIDFSKLFVDTCNLLREKGQLNYTTLVQGDLVQKHVASVDPSLDRRCVDFQQGDACCLPLNIGQFECVLAANLICRLHTPQLFFDRLPNLVSSGGILVLTTPYTFMSQFTPKDNWVGGWLTKEGKEFTGFDGIKEKLSQFFELIAEENLPFVIRETQRKFQLTVSHASVWRRR